MMAPEITEEDVAKIALQVGCRRASGVASYDDLRAEVPLRHALSSIDLRHSPSRKRERIWEQKIRNIQSHYDEPGNFIREGYLAHVPRTGYRVTAKGRKLAKARGYA